MRLAGAERLVPLLIAAFLLGSLALDAALYGHGLRVLRFPLLVGLVTAGLCALVILLPRRAAAPAEPATEAVAAAPRPAIPQVMALMAVLPAVYLFGLVLGPALYVLGHVKLNGARWPAALAAAALALLAGAGFVLLLGVPQPRGTLAWP